jgi:hypothetical protein
MASPQSGPTGAGIRMDGRTMLQTDSRKDHTMTGEPNARTGFVPQPRAATLVELIAAVALIFSIAVAGTAVSIGIARTGAPVGVVSIG